MHVLTGDPAVGLEARLRGVRNGVERGNCIGRHYQLVNGTVSMLPTV